MSLNITPEIKAAYRRYLDEQIDSDFRGTPIRRRDTHPYVVSKFAGLVDFAAGAEAQLTTPTPSQDGWRTSADGLTRTRIAPDAAAPMIPSECVTVRFPRTPPQAAPEPATTAMSDACRIAFERHIGGEMPRKLLFKRGGTVFAESVPTESYVDNGIQHRWLQWQAAWAGAIAAQAGGA